MVASRPVHPGSLKHSSVVRSDSLSQIERVGVRGNRTQSNPAPWTTPGGVKLWESPRQSRGFPERPK